MKKKSFMMLVVFTIFMISNVVFASDSEVRKKIVSVVYDDSGSMIWENKYSYSDYALQIFTASLGKEDKLNVVRMSNYYNNNEIDLSNQSIRQKHIDEIRGYQHNAGTPFGTIDTARDWLIKETTHYKDEADYWFVVITDGEFADMPFDIEGYFENLDNSFKDVNYEFIFLSIGYSYDESFKDAVENSSNGTNLTASNKKEIYSSIMEISKMINNGASEKIAVAEQTGNRTIKLTSRYPLKKMMFLLQDTDNKVKSIKKSNSNLNTETYNVEHSVESLKGTLTHIVHPTKKYLDVGEYQVEFEQDIDMNQMTVLCEAYVRAKISIVDDNDNVLNDSDSNFSTANRTVKIKCELYNIADDTKIPANDESANIKVELVNDKNRYKLVFDKNKNAYYGNATMLNESNSIYAMVEADDLFRIKSNMLVVDTIAASADFGENGNEAMKFEIPYSFKKDYEFAGQFTFSFVEEGEFNVAQDFELQLIDVPDGIKFEYDGKQYDNNDKIPMVKEFGKNYMLKILANKDYSEQEEKSIILKILTDEFDQRIYWTSNGVDEERIVLTPKAYPIKLLKKNIGNEIDVQNETLDLSTARVADESNILSIVEPVKIENIKTITDNSSIMSGFPYKIEKDEKNNLLKITFKPNIFALLGDKKTNVEIQVKFDNGFEETTYNEEIIITNIDVMSILKPYICLAILLVILMGYFAKKKFNKKAQITITENGEIVSYSLKPNIATVLVPYMAHKTKIGMIEFKAGKNSELIYSAKNLDVLKIDGEPLEEYKENHKFNAEKLIMKKDISSIIINAYDVEQKYEYLTKEVDMTSGGDGYTDDYSGDFSGGDDYSSDTDFGDYGF